MKSRGVIYAKEQLKFFKKSIPSLKTILWCRMHNFMLVVGPNRQMSFLEIRTMKNDYFYLKEYRWYLDQKFAQSDKVEIKWYMIRKDIVPNSTRKNWDEQCALISEIETVPNAPEFAWAITTYKAVRGIYLFGGICARVSSLDSGGHHVRVGYFGDKGLNISDYWGYDCHGFLGLSVARKNDIKTLKTLK